MSSLFDPEFIKTLERLTHLAKKIFSGEVRQERRREKGKSLEFAEHREYSPGDDLRYVDWNVYGRLDQLVVKEYQAERDLVATVLLDASGSMGLGSPPKGRYALLLAAAVGYIALQLFEELDLVRLPFAPGDPVKGYRGKGQIFEFFTDLERHPPPAGAGEMAPSLRAVLARHPGRGRAVLLSDLAQPAASLATAFRYLTVKRLPTDVVQVVAPDELDPPGALDGAVRMAGAEGEPACDLDLDRRARQRYKDAVAAHLAAVREAALRSRLAYHRARSDVPFFDSMRALLETGELLR